MADVFISHSSADHDVAQMLCNKLEAQGITCWMAPRDIIPGEDWAKSITEAITKSSVFLVIYSKNSAQSTQVPREIGLAGARKLCIIPYKIDDTRLEGEFEYYLLNSHWVTADIAKNDYKINEVCTAVYSATGKKINNNPAAGTYINNVTITEVRDNKVVCAPVMFKKAIFPIACVVLLIVAILLFIGLGGLEKIIGFKENSEQTSSSSVSDVVKPDDGKSSSDGQTSEESSLGTVEKPSGNSNVTVVPTDLEPYECTHAYFLSKSFDKSVKVAGIEYNTAVVLLANWHDNQIMLNIGGEYSKMSFTLGREDGNDYEKDIAVRVWLDGGETEPMRLQKAALPKNYEFDVTGVKHIKIAADSHQFNPGVVLTDFCLYKNSDDKTVFNAPLAYDTSLDKLNVPVDLAPYECIHSYVLNKSFDKSVKVAGVEHNTAVVLEANWHDNHAMLNVGGEYAKMSFTLGRVDGSDYEKDIIVRVWLDGVEAEPIKLQKAALPKNYEFDVTSVKHIKIAADSYGFAPSVALTDFYFYKNSADKTVFNAPVAFDKNLEKLNIPSDLEPYEYHHSYLVKKGSDKSVKVAGVSYDNGVVLEANWHDNQIMLNTGGEYAKMTFTLGRVDNFTYEKDIPVRIWLDGVETEPIRIQKDALPEIYEYDVTGVKHIKIAADYNSQSAHIAFTDFSFTK